MAEPNIIRQPHTKTNVKTLVEFAPDTFPPTLLSIEITLGANPGDITVLEIPEGACGFRLATPKTQEALRFAIDKDPEQQVFSGDLNIPASAYAQGNSLVPGFFEVRTFETTAKTLRIAVDENLSRVQPAVGLEVVQVEFF